MKQINTLLTVAMIFFWSSADSFCGFYVAKAGADLYNNKSEVILVRDGKHTTITMSNDFKGNVQDFAMVVPVPNVLKREDITIADAQVFRTLDAYSSPRLVEYYDHNPCEVARFDFYDSQAVSLEEVSESKKDLYSVNRKYKVKIEAQYEVDEYDILILSAKNSSGLKDWLIENGYKIPQKAEEVLEPYIKSGLKFFVVKVDLSKYDPSQNGGFLRPLQIKVSSDRFMLPIRLGMANSVGEQDMIVYSFSKKGRIECTNYRTVEMSTGQLIPTFVKNNFGTFYSDLFRNAHAREGRDAVFVEYAWNVTPSWSGVKCDPCVGNPPYFTDLSKAGVTWSNSSDPIYFTRLHVRYTLDKFPEDLFFQETPNQLSYQARYVITHPATGDLSCNQGMTYQRALRERRQKELRNMEQLAQWDKSEFYDYVANGSDKIRSSSQNRDQNEFIPWYKGGNSGIPPISQLLFVLFFGGLLFYSVTQLKRQWI